MVCGCGDDRKAAVVAPLQPEEKRHCTDFLCFLIWWTFIAGMVGVAGYALAEGNYKRVVGGIDYRGCICGTDGVDCQYPGVERHRVEATDTTMFASPFSKGTGSPNGGWDPVVTGDSSAITPLIMCVSECVGTDPTTTASQHLINRTTDGIEDVAIFCHDPVTSAFTFPNVAAPYTMSGPEIADHLVNSQGCSRDQVWYSFETYELFGYCLPAVDSAFIEAVAGEENSLAWTQAISSINNGWDIMLAACFSALVIGLAYIFLLNWCATPLTILSVVVTQVLLVMGGVMLILEANKVADTFPDDSYKQDQTWQMDIAGGVIMLVIAALFLCFMCFMWSRIMLALRMVSLASKAVVANCCMTLFPFYMTLLGVGVIAWWATTAVFLFSISTITETEVAGVPSGLARSIELDDDARYALLFHLVGLFWVPQFLTAFTEMTIAFVACAWFFAPRDSQHRREMPARPVCSACYATARYHIGTIAFGSLIMAIILMVRAVMEYIYHRVRKASRDNTCVKAVYCMCSCCFYCIERCMKFINTNAYIMTVLTKQGFCSSAAQAFNLIMSNLARVGALAAIATSFAFLGKIFIAVVSTSLAYFVFTTVEPYSDPSSSGYVAPFVPCLVVFVFGYAVGMIMMTVYHTTVDAMLLSFLFGESHPHALDEQTRQVIAEINTHAHDRFGHDYDDQEATHEKTNPANATVGDRPSYR